MLNPKSIDDSSSSLSSRTASIRSSYFISEFQECVCEGTISDESNSVCGLIDKSIEVRGDLKRSSIDSSLKKKVSISVQADRSIIGKEDSLPKERKRWARPPVVGQASVSDNNLVPVCQSLVSSESEEELKPKACSRGKQSDFVIDHDIYNKKETLSEKTLEGSDQSLPTGGELSDFQRVPTPSSISSAASRPLEWDSGADVGYYLVDASQCPDHELSSIERLALDQGRNGILIRSDPEGKSSTKQIQSNFAVFNLIGPPTSESTPISISSKQGNLMKKNKTVENITHNSRHQHLFPEVIIERKGDQSDSSSESKKKYRKNKNDTAIQSPPKKSSSLENVNDCKTQDRQNATFPRSQSQLYPTEATSFVDTSQIQKVINPPQSVSSSSIATVVTGSPHKTSKCIQTSCHKNNAATQSSLLDATKKHDNSRGYKSLEQNDSSTLESVQMSADDRVNSFEYLPGHIYENVHKSEDQLTWENGLTLKDDIERGVQLLEEFVQGSNANNTLMKKELIQRVVKRLIQVDYPEDDESQNSVPLRCSTRRSQNRDEAIGESSSENVRGCGNNPTGNSTSLSGQSSSVWLPGTESSKSSDPSDPKITNKNPVYIQKKNMDEDKKKPKSTTDYTSDTKSDWKAPITKAEQLYENKRKGAKINGEHKLLEFLNSERENQLDWIVQEIDHLSNLKSLLEKHQKLRRNLQRLKKERQLKESKNEDIKSTNHLRLQGYRRRPLLGSDIPNRPTSVSANMNSHQKDKTEENTWDSHNYDTNTRQRKTVSTETRKEDIFGARRSTSYTITFANDQAKNKPSNKPGEKPLIADRQTLAKESRDFVRETYHLPSLQDYLLSKRPDIVNRAENRRKTVAELVAVRQLREEKRPTVLAAAISSESCLMPPPPPPLVKRVVSQKEMRQQTEKKYRQTFEVKKKVSERKLKETLKTNRLMADIYNKRLQLLTLKGRTDLSNSIDVISTV